MLNSIVGQSANFRFQELKTGYQSILGKLTPNLLFCQGHHLHSLLHHTILCICKDLYAKVRNNRLRNVSRVYCITLSNRAPSFPTASALQVRHRPTHLDRIVDWPWPDMFHAIMLSCETCVGVYILTYEVDIHNLSRRSHRDHPIAKEVCGAQVDHCNFHILTKDETWYYYQHS